MNLMFLAHSFACRANQAETMPGEATTIHKSYSWNRKHSRYLLDEVDYMDRYYKR
jgi:hypothetical protein